MSRYYAGRPREPGFVMKHLLGEYSLARSYWLHTVFIGWGVATLSAWTLRHVISEQSPMRHLALALLTLQATALLIWLWSVTGTWMAALRRLFMGGGRLWAVLAMLTLGTAIWATIGEAWQWRPDLEELWTVARGGQPSPSFRLERQADGRTLAFRGGINEGAAAALEAEIAAAPKLTTLLLDSPGGWIREGQRMAEVVRRHRLNTRVEQECYSSCTIVLLGGLNRSAGPRAQIGFHRGRPMGHTRRSHAPVRAEESAVFTAAGLDEAFVQRILATPSDTIWVPSHEELVTARVLTR
ncbi:MAG TPA: hypothetical protein VGQ91_05190 [Ideonella sp.]|jgi:hypothetical protein|nr:hypothetical protein [Ideonella sp.]